MIRDRALRIRDKLVNKLPVTGELVRGSLLERRVRHRKDCPKCARGEATVERSQVRCLEPMLVQHCIDSLKVVPWLQHSQLL